MADDQTNLPHRPPPERYYTESEMHRVDDARLLRTGRATLLGALVPVLKWVGAAMVLISCTLLVYLGTGLLARLVVWAIFP